MDLLKLLEEEEKFQGVKMGYKVFCYRSGDWFWKCDFGDNYFDGMIEDLILEKKLTEGEIKELIEDKVLRRNACCDTYYAIAVY